jgi:hypothetical protein
MRYLILLLICVALLGCSPASGHWYATYVLGIPESDLADPLPCTPAQFAAGVCFGKGSPK